MHAWLESVVHSLPCVLETCRAWSSIRRANSILGSFALCISSRDSCAYALCTQVMPGPSLGGGPCCRVVAVSCLCLWRIALYTLELN